MLRNISAWHVIIVLLVVVLLFGAKRLPDLAKSVGQSMKIFKHEVKDLRDDDAPTATTTTTTPPVAPSDVTPVSAPPAVPRGRAPVRDPGPARHGAVRGHRPAEGLTRT